MAGYKTPHGILAMVDIVGFTGQATRLGEKYHAQYSAYFEEKISAIVKKYKYRVIKSMGDAILFFGKDARGIHDIMLDLYDRDKPEDKYGFVSKFRMVAHSGFFQFKIKNNRPIDLVSPEGIKVFRLEKHAQAWECVVTQELYKGIKQFLTGKNIEAALLEVKEPLKGFDNEPWSTSFYRLRIVKDKGGVSNLLTRRLDELEKDVQFIPVFGKIYEPVPMKENFVNLKILFNTSNDNTKIDISTIYENHRKAIILGLPGAGKTTILRHLAFKEFEDNKEKPDNQKQIVLFISCRDIPLYNEWYKEYHHVFPAALNWEDALEFFLWVFLFGNRKNIGGQPEDWKEFKNGFERIKKAFLDYRVTLLLDSLDEATEKEKREQIFQLFKILISGNHLYLTSRLSELIHLKPDAKGDDIPCFRVLDLDREQIRRIARNLLKADSPIYKKFDQAIWKEDMVLKIAQTPLTALLVTAYFHAYEKFENRFPMYDLLVKFILLKVWEDIKTNAFLFKNMEVFFEEVKRSDFFKKYTETKIAYDAVAALCFNLFYKSISGNILRIVGEDDLRAYFIHFITERNYYISKEAAISKAEEWEQQFYRDHLLLRSGKREYVFVHWSVMEFLAAYHIVEEEKRKDGQLPVFLKNCMEREDYFELETIPIAAGSSLMTSFNILATLKDLSVLYSKSQISEMGIRCLAELEMLIEKSYQTTNIKVLAESISELIQRNRKSFQWVYEYLNNLLISEDVTYLKKLFNLLDGKFQLTRDTLLKEHLEYESFSRGSHETFKLRKKLLFKLVRHELVEDWLKNYERSFSFALQGEAEYDMILQLDSPQYHPEDKNFNYYKRVIGNELVGFFGSPNLRHSDGVKACAVSPDGKWVASASDDRLVKLWKTGTGKEIQTLSGPQKAVLCCSFSFDSKFMVSSSEDHTLKLWDLAKMKEIQTLIGHQDSVSYCAFSPDGRWVISASDDKTLKLWDVTTGKERQTLNGEKGHRNYVSCGVFSPDGKRVISASLDRTLKLWNIETGQEPLTFIGHSRDVYNCAFSPDGKWVVSASKDRTLKLWDVETGKEKRSLPGHMGDVYSCAFSRDGKHAISASNDRTLKLWSIRTGKEIRTMIGHRGDVYGCTFSPDNHQIISASSDKTLIYWDIESGQRISELTGHLDEVNCCAFSPDGKHLISGSNDQALRLWDIDTGKEIDCLKGHKGYISSCAFSPDGRYIASASYDKTVKLWDVRTMNEIRTLTEDADLNSPLAFSRNGRHIASSSLDFKLRFWEVESVNEIRTETGHKDYIYCCAFSSDGRRVVSGSKDKTLKVWNFETKEELFTLKGHEHAVTSCVFSRNALWIVSASDDTTLKLWDTNVGEEIRTFLGHEDSVSCCVFSIDGRYIISVSKDRTLKLWESNTGKLVKSLSLPWIPKYIALSPLNNGQVITANRNGTLTLFEFDELKRNCQ